MSATLKIDMQDFNRQIERVRGKIGRNAGSYVRTSARRLIRRLAWKCPQAQPRYAATGRLRAGFWPAALALNITNIYTRAPNKNEGEGIDNTTGSHPSFTIRNRVPYIGDLKHGLGWANDALDAVRVQMARDLMKYAADTWSNRSMIDDLTAQ